MPVPFGAQHRHPVAVPHLQVERPGQADELQSLADHRPLARATTGQAYPDPLFLRRQRRRTSRLELAQPGLRGLVTGRPCPKLYDAFCLCDSISARSLACSSSHRRRSLLQPVMPRQPRRVPGREAARMGPGRSALHLRRPPGPRCWASSSRSWRDEEYALVRSRSRASSHRFAGTSRKSSGSSSSSTSSGPRSSSSRANRFCSPPDKHAYRRGPRRLPGISRAPTLAVSKPRPPPCIRRPRPRPPAPPRNASWARCASASGSEPPPPPPPLSLRPAARTARRRGQRQRADPASVTLVGHDPADELPHHALGHR